MSNGYVGQYLSYRIGDLVHFCRRGFSHWIAAELAERNRRFSDLRSEPGSPPAANWQRHWPDGYAAVFNDRCQAEGAACTP
jgi:hypothetical protein